MVIPLIVMFMVGFFAGVFHSYGINWIGTVVHDWKEFRYFQKSRPPTPQPFALRYPESFAPQDNPYKSIEIIGR